jgi:ribose 5-phosphate isomerase B
MSTVYIASDHAGFRLKAFLVPHLLQAGHTVHDLGPADAAPSHYPERARPVVAQVLAHPEAFGILVCGSGIGMSMAANRTPGIRAAMAVCEFHAHVARAHNNANILCLGERVTGQGLAVAITETFLATPFAGGRHTHRVELLDCR